MHQTENQALEQLFSVLLMFLLLNCHNRSGAGKDLTPEIKPTDENPYKLIKTIPLPEGFGRIKADSASFAEYLRNIGLKKTTTVYLFNGQPKSNQSAQYALLNVSTGHKDLQQCADAVMRLRAEYLFARKQFDRIVFYDNAKTAYTLEPPYSRERFDAYLTRVFGMCGSASLAKQLNPVNNFYTIQPGDVLIRGGFPGHAVIVMDVAINETGEKIYLLAQGYMPAQDIHVLKNPSNNGKLPWYEVNDNKSIITPEYTFRQTELMRW